MNPMDADDRLSPGNVGTSSRVVVHAMGQTRMMRERAVAEEEEEEEPGRETHGGGQTQRQRQWWRWRTWRTEAGNKNRY